MRKPIRAVGLNRWAAGFTLAELLIALAILGVIAVFTIPKVLQAQQDGRWNSSAEDAAAMVSAAYNLYKAHATPTAGTKFADLTQYMNYVRIETAILIDHTPPNTSMNCAWSGYPCLVLHTGGILMGIPNTFGGTGTTNAIHMYFDPDGTYSNTTNGPGKSVQFFLYLDGRMTDAGNIEPGTYGQSWGPVDPDPTKNPPWFHWN